MLLSTKGWSLDVCLIILCPRFDLCRLLGRDLRVKLSWNYLPRSLCSGAWQCSSKLNKEVGLPRKRDPGYIRVNFKFLLFHHQIECTGELLRKCNAPMRLVPSDFELPDCMPFNWVSGMFSNSVLLLIQRIKFSEKIEVKIEWGWRWRNRWSSGDLHFKGVWVISHEKKKNHFYLWSLRR